MNIAAGRTINASMIVTALQRSATLQRRQSLRMSRSPEVGLMGVASAAMFRSPAGGGGSRRFVSAGSHRPHYQSVPLPG